MIISNPHHFTHLICQVALYRWGAGMGSKTGMCELALLLMGKCRRSTGVWCRRQGAQEPQERLLGRSKRWGGYCRTWLAWWGAAGSLPVENLDCSPFLLVFRQTSLLWPLELKERHRKENLAHNKSRSPCRTLPPWIKTGSVCQQHPLLCPYHSPTLWRCVLVWTPPSWLSWA